MKYVYLDQMHWIALAKAANGRSDGSEYVDILHEAQSAVKARQLVFPLSFAHILETARAPKLEQRTALARVMTILSRGVVLRWSRPIVEHQLRNAVRELFEFETLHPEPSPFGKGVENVLNFKLSDRLDWNPDRISKLRSLIDTSDAWIDLLSHTNEESRLAAIKSSERTASESVHEYENRRVTWAGESVQLMRRAYAVFLTKLFWDELQCYLHEIGHTIKEWGAIGPRRIMQFWESIPSLHVELELHTQMHRQLTKAWTTHDGRDIGFLSLAVPVCHVVVTEKFWVDLVHRRKLHDRYGTLMLSDLRDLLKYLGNE